MHDAPTTIVGLMHVALRIHGCRSLKEKRSALKPCIQRLQERFRIAVAEVGDHDVWGSAIVAAAAVSGDKTCVENALGQALRYLEECPEVEVVDQRIEIL